MPQSAITLPQSSTTMRHPLTLRLLHLAMIAGIATQLFTSEFMKAPRIGRTISDWQLGNFVVHDGVGLVLLGVLAAFLVREAAMRRRGGLAVFVPWAGAEGRSALAKEGIALLGTPRHAAQRLFRTARTVQGAGLALLAFLGTSGWAMHGPLDRGERLTGVLRLVRELHEAAGSLLWFWLALHVAIALPPLFAGRRAILDIFRFGRPGRGA